jgi:hypothetical protein
LAAPETKREDSKPKIEFRNKQRSAFFSHKKEPTASPLASLQLQQQE